MARAFAFASLIVFGLMAADLLRNPKGTSALLGGVTALSKNTGNQLEGYKA